MRSIALRRHLPHSQFWRRLDQHEMEVELMAVKVGGKRRHCTVVEYTCRQQNTTRKPENMWVLKKCDDGERGMFYLLPNKEYSIGRKGITICGFCSKTLFV